MKHLIVYLTILFFTITAAFAIEDSTYVQYDTSEVNVVDSIATPFYTMLNSVFENLSTNEVTSGFLIDRAFPLIRYSLFDGVNLHDSNACDYSRFMRLYGTLVQANVDAGSQLPDVDDYKDSLTTYKANGYLPIGLMDVDYQQLLDSAVADSLVYFSGIQLFDVAGRSQSPYTDKNIFAAATPAQFPVEAGTSFILPQSLFLENSGKTISTIQIDFDDGQGWSDISWDSPVQVNYSTGGEKDITLEVTYTDQSSRQAHFLIEVLDPSGRYADGMDEEYEIPAVGGEHDGGRIQIAYGCGNDKLIKPLILVEGFNPDEWGIIKLGIF